MAGLPESEKGFPNGRVELNRIWLALRTFWRIITEPDSRLASNRCFQGRRRDPICAFWRSSSAMADWSISSKRRSTRYSDAQIGAAVRDIHRGCRKSLHDYLTIEPVIDAAEEQRVTVPVDFDPAAIRLVGNVNGSPPFQGVLKHHGWRVRSVHLPLLPVARDDASVLSPAEVEILIDAPKPTLVAS